MRSEELFRIKSKRETFCEKNSGPQSEPEFCWVYLVIRRVSYLLMVLKKSLTALKKPCSA